MRFRNYWDSARTRCSSNRWPASSALRRRVSSPRRYVKWSARCDAERGPEPSQCQRRGHSQKGRLYVIRRMTLAPLRRAGQGRRLRVEPFRGFREQPSRLGLISKTTRAAAVRLSTPSFSKMCSRCLAIEDLADLGVGFSFRDPRQDLSLATSQPRIRICQL